MASMTRAGFVGVAATALGLCALGGAARALGGESVPLRPPAVRDEDDFASRCVRCYRCIEVCPTRVLVPAGFENGLLNVKTPMLDFRRGVCEFCDKCVRVCPTEAIVHADPHNPAAGRIGVAVIDPERCLAFGHGCQICADECPYDALTIKADGTPHVDEARCNGCGVCVHKCPALVYRSYGGGTKRGVAVVASGDPSLSSSKE